MVESYYLYIKQGLMPVPTVEPCQVGSDLDVVRSITDVLEAVEPCQVGSDLVRLGSVGGGGTSF